MVLKVGHLGKVGQKCPQGFEMLCWIRMEGISWTGRGKKLRVLRRVKEKKNILHTIKRRTPNWIGHILRRIYFLKYVTEGKIEGTEDEEEGVST
jgi:hypothetical protein